MFTLDLGNLLVHLGLDDKNFTQVYQKAEQRIRLAGEQLEKQGRALTMKLTVPLLGLAGAMTKTAISMESAFAGVRKTINATAEQLADLKKGFDAMSETTPLPVEEIYAIGQAAGQLGIRTENILGFTKVMADLGATTNLASQEAAMALARFANITQMSQKDFDRLGATIVALGNNMATTERETVELAVRMAGAAKIVGITEAQTMALGAALSSVGMEAEAGGTAMSKVLLDMYTSVQQGNEKLDIFARLAGRSAEQFAEAFKKDAATAFITFLEGLGKAHKAGADVTSILDQLGMDNVRVTRAMLGAATAGDLFRRALQLGSKAWEENIALTREAGQRYATTGSQLRLMWNSIRLGMESFGDILAQRLMDLLKPVKPIVEWFKKLDDSTKQLLVTMGTLLALFGPVEWIVGKVVISFITLETALRGAGAGAMFLQKSILALFVALAAFELGKYFYKNFDWVAKQATAMVGVVLEGWESIKYGAVQAGTFIKGIWTNLGSWTQSLFSKLALMVGNFLQQAEIAASALSDIYGGPKLTDLGSAKMKQIGIALRKAARESAVSVTEEYAANTANYRKAMAEIEQLITTALEDIDSRAQKSKDQTGGKVADEAQKVADDLAAAFQKIKTAVEAGTEGEGVLLKTLTASEQTMRDMLDALWEEEQVTKLVNEGWERGADILAFQKAAFVAFKGDWDKVLEAVEQYKRALREAEKLHQFDNLKRWLRDNSVVNFWKNTSDVVVRGLDSFADTLTDLMMTGKANWREFCQALLRDWLAMIIRMQMATIAKQAESLLPQVVGFIGGLLGAGAAKPGMGMAGTGGVHQLHEGGIAGVTRAPKIFLPAYLWDTAPPYHGGSDEEVAIWAKKNEHVLTEDQMGTLVGMAGRPREGVLGQEIQDTLKEILYWTRRQRAVEPVIVDRREDLAAVVRRDSLKRSTLMRKED